MQTSSAYTNIYHNLDVAQTNCFTSRSWQASTVTYFSVTKNTVNIWNVSKRESRCLSTRLLFSKLLGIYLTFSLVILFYSLHLFLGCRRISKPCLSLRQLLYHFANLFIHKFICRCYLKIFGIRFQVRFYLIRRWSNINLIFILIPINY